MADQLPNVEGDNGSYHEATPVIIFDAGGQPVSSGGTNSYSATGTISALGGEVVLNFENCSGGLITFNGTFTGSLTITGATLDTSSVFGGRLSFQSGVGSTGTNVARGNGPVSREVRYVAGGSKVRVRATEWTSGSVNIEISAQSAPTVLFINGPVHNAEEEAVRNTRGFTAQSGVVPVPAGNVLITTLQNPANSGVNVFIRARRFTNDRAPTATNLEFIGYANPTYSPTVVGTSVNLFAGRGGSQSIFRSQVRDATGLTVGGIQGLGEILPNGRPEELGFDFILGPGNGLGILIQGDGKNVSNAVRMSVGLRWYEEQVG